MLGQQARLPIYLMYNYGTVKPSSSVSLRCWQDVLLYVKCLRACPSKDHQEQAQMPARALQLQSPWASTSTRGRGLVVYSSRAKGSIQETTLPLVGSLQGVQRLLDAIYEVQYLRNHCKQVVHFDRLKPCFREECPVDKIGTTWPLVPRIRIHPNSNLEWHDAVVTINVLTVG